MKPQKTKPWILTVLLLLPISLIVAVLFFSHPKESDVISRKKPVTPLEQIDSFFTNLPLTEEVRQMGLNIRYKTGETQQKGIYISERGLLKEISPPDEEIVSSNNETLLTIMEYTRDNSGPPMALMLLPSSAAILQQNLPAFSNPINQRNYIENIYNQFTGKATTIDAYNTLLRQKEKYIYYRTENNLTPLGGYYISSEIIRWLLVGEPIIPLSHYDVTYGSDFYGSVYHKLPYQKVQPDIYMYYNYERKNSRYKVIHTDAKHRGVYQKLYPYQEEEDRGMESYLGGSKGKIEIQSMGIQAKNLLVLGDKTAISYLPFLADHYQKITFVNLQDSQQQLQTIDFWSYDQILIGISLEHYGEEEIFIELEKLIMER